MARKLVEYPLYPRQYYSGANVHVMFNHIPIKELIAIQYSVQQPIIPIYGYASYTYDAVAHGQRIVTGSLRINFIESNYLKTVIERLAMQNISSSSANLTENTAKVRNYLEAEYQEGQINYELLNWIKGNSTDKILQEARQLESKLWGDSYDITENHSNASYFNPEINGDRINSSGFDIIITYGEQTLAIDTNDDKWRGATTIINGAHLTGISQVIAPTGEAIAEDYTFIAKDINNSLIQG